MIIRIIFLSCLRFNELLPAQIVFIAPMDLLDDTGAVLDHGAPISW